MLAARRGYEPFDGVFKPSPRSTPCAMLAFVLFCVSVVNGAVALYVSKPYTLLAQPASDRPATRSASLENDVWVLRMWRPDTLWFYILLAFSPAHALTGWFAPSGAAFIVNLAVSGLLVALAAKFNTLVGDRFVLDSNVMKEYSCKVVYPATSVATRDVAVQVGPSSSLLAGPSTPRREFVQRDVRTPFTPFTPYVAPKTLETPLRTPSRAAPTSFTPRRNVFNK